MDKALRTSKSPYRGKEIGGLQHGGVIMQIGLGSPFPVRLLHWGWVESSYLEPTQRLLPLLCQGHSCFSYPPYENQGHLWMDSKVSPSFTVKVEPLIALQSLTKKPLPQPHTSSLTVCCLEIRVWLGDSLNFHYLPNALSDLDSSMVWGCHHAPPPGLAPRVVVHQPHVAVSAQGVAGPNGDVLSVQTTASRFEDLAPPKNAVPPR